MKYYNYVTQIVNVRGAEVIIDNGRPAHFGTWFPFFYTSGALIKAFASTPAGVNEFWDNLAVSLPHPLPSADVAGLGIIFDNTDAFNFNTPEFEETHIYDIYLKGQAAPSYWFTVGPHLVGPGIGYAENSPQGTETIVYMRDHGDYPGSPVGSGIETILVGSRATSSAIPAEFTFWGRQELLPSLNNNPVNLLVARVSQIVAAYDERLVPGIVLKDDSGNVHEVRAIDKVGRKQWLILHTLVNRERVIRGNT